MTAAAEPESLEAIPVAIRPDAAARRLVVLYDRDCGICQATARRLERWDRDDRLEVLALQVAAGSDRPALAAVARSYPLLDTLHVVDLTTGRVAAGGAAVFAIGAALPGGALVRALGIVPPFRWFVAGGYALIARNRHALGRLLGVEGPACDVPAR